MKKTFLCLIPALYLCFLCACGSVSEAAVTGGSEKVTLISLNGDTAEVKGAGASAKGNIVTISASGSYSVTGTFTDGQIVVNTGDDPMAVTLTLDNAHINSLSGPAIYVKQAKDLNLILAPGSKNTVVSGTQTQLGVYDENASGAAIFAEDDLDIDGSEDSSLNVYGYINSGIGCKNDIDINGGNINVTAVNNGIKGSDSVEIKGGTITVNSGNDGIKSSTADKDGKGFIYILDGSVSVTSMGDGIDAETELAVSGGSLNVTATGSAQGSSKAIKAQNALNISGGELVLSSQDKGIASNGSISLTGGSIQINSADDGIETPADINIGEVTLSVVSGGDGIRAGEPNSGIGNISVNGGSISIYAAQDAVDAKGSFDISGGRILALGSSKKSLVPDGGTQLFIASEISGSNGETVTVSAGGSVLGTVAANGAYNYVFYSAADMVSGGEYIISNGKTEFSLLA